MRTDPGRFGLLSIALLLAGATGAPRAHAAPIGRASAALSASAAFIASDGSNDDELGTSLAVSGSMVVVGAPGASVAGHARQGAVYVYTAGATGAWHSEAQVAKLTASDGAAGDELGSSVAISGSTIVVGAPGARGTPEQGGQGAAYVFSLPATGHWRDGTQTAELLPSDGASGDGFGASVAAGGTIAVVGAPEHTIFGQGGAGAAYVFSEPTAGWRSATQSAELLASDARPGDELGYAVGTDGATVAASAPGHAVGANLNQGAVYAFAAPAGGRWQNAVQTAELTASDGAADDRLGDGVAVAGSTIAAGDAARSTGPNPGQGALLIFSPAASGRWTSATQSAELTASDGAAGDGLGFSVAASPTLVVAGAPNRSVAGQDRAGAVYEFPRPASGRWASATQSGELTVGAQSGSELGFATALSGSAVLGGAPFLALAAHEAQGAAFAAGQPPAPPAPPAPPVPQLTHVGQLHAVWREGSRLAAAAARRAPPRPPLGTRFSFRLNVAGQVRLTFTELLSRHRALPRGALRFSVRAGARSIRFEGRVTRSRRLPVGRYEVSIVALSSAGRTSRPAHLRFTVTQ